MKRAKLEDKMVVRQVVVQAESKEGREKIWWYRITDDD